MAFSPPHEENFHDHHQRSAELRMLHKLRDTFQKEAEFQAKETETQEALETSSHGLYAESLNSSSKRPSNFWPSYLNQPFCPLGVSESLKSLKEGPVRFLNGALKHGFWLAQMAANRAKNIFFQKKTIGTWLGTQGFLATKYLSNFVGALFAIVAYTPVFTSIVLVLALYPPTQALLLHYVNFLRSEPWWTAFLWLFWWKAVKISVHTYSYVFLTEANLYRPVPNPKFTPKDVTVIIPSISEFDREFKRTLKTIIANFPAKIIVSTAKQINFNKAKASCKDLEKDLGLRSGTIVVTAVKIANKRAQFVHALKKVETQITCYADDHVFWPNTFLKHAIAPFEDADVGLVGTAKRVERVKTGSFKDRFLNYVALIYLERHNFECTASYNLDGGVFVISGRTALTRTEIMQSIEFRQGFLNEKWWWGTVGPLKVDDDNFITRFMVNHGYKTVFHNEPAALMHTTLGAEGGLEKFRGQLIRWVRTTWRSNSTSLFAERKIWRAHPWTTYAMMISLFFNISLIYDSLLFYTLSRSGYLKEYGCALALFLLVSKTIKQVPHLLRNPDDIFPYGLLSILFFGYIHSLVKIFAFFTAKNTAWSGRKEVDATGDPDHEKGISRSEAKSESKLRPKGPKRDDSSEIVV